METPFAGGAFTPTARSEAQRLSGQRLDWRHRLSPTWAVRPVFCTHRAALVLLEFRSEFSVPISLPIHLCHIPSVGSVGQPGFRAIWPAGPLMCRVRREPLKRVGYHHRVQNAARLLLVRGPPFRDPRSSSRPEGPNALDFVKRIGLSGPRWRWAALRAD